MNGFKAAFKGSMKMYEVLVFKAVGWIKHVTGTDTDSELHYWPAICETCKEIAAFIEDWEAIPTKDESDK